MNEYWFKPKRYGYGGYPITWQGWLSLFSLIILIMTSFLINITISERILTATLKDWSRFALDFVILTTLFHVVFKDKVDGGLKWRWGKE